MKSENKICYLYALLYSYYLLVFVLLLQLFAIPVQAAELWSLKSNYGQYDINYDYTDHNNRNCHSYHHLYLNNNQLFYGFIMSDETLSVKPYMEYHSYRLYAYSLGSNNDPYIYSDSNAYPKFFTDYNDNILSAFQMLDKHYLYDGSDMYYYGGSLNFLINDIQSTFAYKPDPSSGEWINVNFSLPLPVFDSVDSMKKYCLTGDTSGLLNGGGSIDNPDFEDTAYAFTGFTANNKMTATWTGTTERTYLQDQEVEEYVRVNYYFADKEAQDTIKQADAYPDEFATADKTLTIDVSGLKPDDENWFLRYIRITPCYRQSGLGAWGDFYHGDPSYVYFNQDGSIDRIDAPYIKGELSTDMERPVIVLHEAANGNPTESDYSYFEFNNAQSDYFFEMKGRWYTTNDFDLYRDKLVWKYKYSTLLKNNLSTWVSVSDNRSSVGRFQFDVLGKSSWDNLLSSYPVDDRNYIGGSYNLFNKITGYSDALETLKMLLKQPYSLFNGYEVYVRYFRYDENGGIQYSKWTHFYNNLADSDGSSGSRLDDLDNMYSENQSDKGLTDDELSDLENGGNSRNDLDAVPKNNYDYSSLENATMNFFDLLKNFGTMLGQFPSMVTDVFGFLPPWLIGLIALAIGAVIVCRFIGR